MIYTVTLNPALDYVMHVKEMKAGNILRSCGEAVFFGGKGINVSTILREHNVSSVAMGFVAGFTGGALENGLESKGIQTDFVHLENGLTRINVKIRADEETDINAGGPAISEAELNALYEKLEQLQAGDTLVLAGSIPPSLPENIYEKIMERLADKGVRFVVDATGQLLVSSLKYRPFLIKPNDDELGELFSVTIDSPEDALQYAVLLQEMGAKNVLVSMGGKGAVLLDETGKEHYMPALKGKVVNTVGAGDSMVAGFIAGFEQTGDFAYALKLGSASGSATAFSEGLADIQSIQKLL